MPRLVKSLLYTLMVFGIVGLIVLVSYYAATNIKFLNNVLLPFLFVTMFGVVWAFFHQEFKR